MGVSGEVTIPYVKYGHDQIALIAHELAHVLDMLHGTAPGHAHTNEPEIVEFEDHPWFIGVQFHPELKSKPYNPHPLFTSFIEAAVAQSRLM